MDHRYIFRRHFNDSDYVRRTNIDQNIHIEDTTMLSIIIWSVIYMYIFYFVCMAFMLLGELIGEIQTYVKEYSKNLVSLLYKTNAYAIRVAKRRIRRERISCDEPRAR